MRAPAQSLGVNLVAVFLTMASLLAEILTMAKTTTAPASAAKTTTTKSSIKKIKKHPWKGQQVAFVGPFIYQETEERTVIMLEDEDSIKPLVNKMGAKFAGHSLAKTTRVVVVGDSERMTKGEVRP